MKYGILMVVPIYLILSCTQGKTKSKTPQNINEKIAGDWVVSRQNEDKLLLTKFNGRSEDGCFVFRFRKPKYFLSFIYTNPPKLSDEMRTNDAYSDWRADTINGTLVINEFRESTTKYERNIISYIIKIVGSDSIILTKDQVIKSVTGFSGDADWK